MNILQVRLLAALLTVSTGLLLLAAPYLRSQEPAASASQQPDAAKTPPATDRGSLRPVGADTQQSATPGKRWALLVGINKYEYASKLHYCGRDVDVLRKALVEHGGYLPEHVHVLSDVAEGNSMPTRGKILIEFTTFLKQTRPEDTVLFAFCGHGQLDKKGKSYLVPIDGNEELLEDTAISVERLYQFLEACPARQKIIILDACHSGGKRGGPEGFDTIDSQPGKGMIELLSCNAVQTSQEDDSLQQGVFSYYLAQAIQGVADVRPVGDEDGEISFDEAYRYVSAQVNRYSRGKQSPVKRGESQGQLTLAVRTAKVAGATLPDDLLTTRLDAEHARGKISAGLHASIRQWLTAEGDFALGRDMRLALSLLARGLVDEGEFTRLVRGLAPQLDSHLQARANLKSRSLRALLIGIEKYHDSSGPGNLRGPLNDARLLEDTLRAHSGENLKTIVRLEDDQATEAAIIAEIKRLAGVSQPGDVLLISFSGHGARGEFFRHPAASVKVAHDGAWLLSQFSQTKLVERLSPANRDHAVSDWLFNDTEDGVLPLKLVSSAIGDTKASVVVLSDSSCDFSDWRKLSDAFEVSPAGTVSFGVAHVPASRLWIGTPSTIESAALGDKNTSFGLLSFLTARALSGQADLATPRFFLPGQLSIGQTATSSRDVKEVSQDVAVASRHPLLVGRPDGYVSFYELATFLVQTAAITAKDKRSERRVTIDVHGYFHPQDVILARSTLPVE